MNVTSQQTARKRPLRTNVAAILFGLAVPLLAGALPASAQTIYDVDIANSISGLSPKVRAEIKSITAASRVQMMAVLEKNGIDPNAKPNMDKLMQAADELQAVSRAQRAAVAKLLQPEEMAQYDTAVSNTTQRIRDAAN